MPVVSDDSHMDRNWSEPFAVTRDSFTSRLLERRGSSTSNSNRVSGNSSSLSYSSTQAFSEFTAEGSPFISITILLGESFH